jgi:hypothetical protein
MLTLRQKARRHLVNCQVNQAVPNPQRDIAAGEHYEIYIGAPMNMTARQMI